MTSKGVKSIFGGDAAHSEIAREARNPGIKRHDSKANAGVRGGLVINTTRQRRHFARIAILVLSLRNYQVEAKHSCNTFFDWTIRC